MKTKERFHCVWKSQNRLFSEHMERSILFISYWSLSSSGQDIVFSCRRHGFDSRKGQAVLLGRFPFSHLPNLFSNCQESIEWLYLRRRVHEWFYLQLRVGRDSCRWGSLTVCYKSIRSAVSERPTRIFKQGNLQAPQEREGQLQVVLLFELRVS